MIQTITIPNWLPPRSNQWYGKHWSKRHELGRQAKTMIAVYAHICGVSNATGKRRVGLEVHGWAAKTLPDHDAFDKLLLDSLVHTGLLLDDSPRGLAGRMQVNVVRSRETQTIITLEDCDEG